MPEVKENLIQEVGSKIQESELRNKEVKTGMVDVAPRAHVPENVKTWLEKIEMDPGMANPIADDSGQQIMTTTAPQNPKIVLPTTRTSFIGGFKKSFDDAGRWLSTFLLRLIKMKQGNVKFKEE